MRKAKMRRNFWRSNEVKCMLGVFKDLNIVKLLEQKTIPINDIYKRVEIEMGQRGFAQKNGKQIQSKWSQMKSAYICIKRNHKADFYMMKDPEFRDEVAELVEADISSRVSSLPALSGAAGLSPRSSMSGVDDSTTNFEDEPVVDDEDNTMTEEHALKQPAYVQMLEPEINRKVAAPSRASIAESIATTPHRQGSYEKSFVKFIQQLRALEFEMQEEFIMKQTRLLAQERKLQMQRDNLVIASFAANTNQILKTTQELLAKAITN